MRRWMMIFTKMSKKEMVTRVSCVFSGRKERRPTFLTWERMMKKKPMMDMEARKRKDEATQPNRLI